MSSQQQHGIGVDVIATFVGVAAVLLPTSGFIARYIAFSVGLNVDNATDAALAASIGLLAWNGSSAFLAYALYLVTLPFYHRLALIDAAIRRSRSRSDRLKRDIDAIE